VSTLIVARVIETSPNLVVNAGFGRIYTFYENNNYNKSDKVSLLIQKNGSADIFNIEHDSTKPKEVEVCEASSTGEIDLDCIE